MSDVSLLKVNSDFSEVADLLNELSTCDPRSLLSHLNEISRMSFHNVRQYRKKKNSRVIYLKGAEDQVLTSGCCFCLAVVSIYILTLILTGGSIKAI